MGREERRDKYRQKTVVKAPGKSTHGEVRCPAVLLVSFMTSATDSRSETLDHTNGLVYQFRYTADIIIRSVSQEAPNDSRLTG